MPEVTIEVSKDIKDLVGETGKAIYIETLKEVHSSGWTTAKENWRI